jgi:hypothetical protein
VLAAGLGGKEQRRGMDSGGKGTGQVDPLFF